MNILKIEGMDFCYKQQFVLKDFVLSVAEGSIYSLVGKPKSGKTTALKLILGLLKTTASTVYIKGQDFYNRRESLQTIVGAIIDLPYYQNYLTVKQNFLYIDMFFGYGDSRIAEVLRFIGLAKHNNTKVKKLTVTQQKLLSIGIALYHNPDLLVFDDLLRDLDEGSKDDICKLLLKIKKKGGTILMSSRNIDDIRNFSTHIGILQNGKIYKEGCSWEFKNEYFQNADLLV